MFIQFKNIRLFKMSKMKQYVKFMSACAIGLFLSMSQAYAFNIDFDKLKKSATELTNEVIVVGQKLLNGEQEEAVSVKPNKGGLSGVDTGRPRNFNDSKKLMYNDVYRAGEGHKTIYCGCDVEHHGKRVLPNLKSCDYKVRKENNRFRAERIEAEHIVPASLIGLQNKCMIENKSMKSKRNYCEKNDPNFRKAYVDLHNLVPAIGEVNLDRSNYPFKEIRTNDVNYGSQCNMSISFKDRQAMPPKAAKGEVARAYLYMSDRYDIRLSKNDRRTYEIWHKQNPPTKWEIEKNKRVKKIQGNSNPYIQNLD